MLDDDHAQRSANEGVGHGTGWGRGGRGPLRGTFRRCDVAGTRKGAFKKEKNRGIQVIRKKAPSFQAPNRPHAG